MIALAWPIASLLIAYHGYIVLREYVAVLHIRALRPPSHQELESAVNAGLKELRSDLSAAEERIAKLESEEQ